MDEVWAYINQGWIRWVGRKRGFWMRFDRVRGDEKA